MHISESFHADADGWWPALCECGWANGPFPDAETAVDDLMQHARERALLEDCPALIKEQGTA